MKQNTHKKTTKKRPFLIWINPIRYRHSLGGRGDPHIPASLSLQQWRSCFEVVGLHRIEAQAGNPQGPNRQRTVLQGTVNGVLLKENSKP